MDESCHTPVLADIDERGGDNTHTHTHTPHTHTHSLSLSLSLSLPHTLTHTHLHIHIHIHIHTHTHTHHTQQTHRHTDTDTDTDTHHATHLSSPSQMKEWVINAKWLLWKNVSASPVSPPPPNRHEHTPNTNDNTPTTHHLPPTNIETSAHRENVLASLVPPPSPTRYRMRHLTYIHQSHISNTQPSQKNRWTRICGATHSNTQLS